MAIKSRRNFKVELGALDLTLQAKTGESLLIKDIKIYSAAIVYANLLIERASVGYYRVGGALGNHLHFLPGRAAHAHNLTTTATVVIPVAGNAGRVQNAGGTETPLLLPVLAASETYDRMMDYEHIPSSGQETLLSYLGKKGIFKGFPVAEGETFTIDMITGADDVKMVEYEIYDAADITNVMENGSKADTYMYVNYGDSGAVITDVAETVLGESNNPAEYPDFPFGGNVPSGHKIEIIGILASDIAPAANVAADRTQTDYLKFMKGREVLFDEDHNGLLYYSPFEDATANCDMIAEGYAVGGNFTQCDCKEPHIFDPPKVFNEGEELTVSWHVIINGTGQDISEALQEVGLILRISPMV